MGAGARNGQRLQQRTRLRSLACSLRRRSFSVSGPGKIVLGVAAPLYHQMLRSLRRARHLPFALVWAGCIVGLLSLLEPAVWGNGDVALRETLRSSAIDWSIASLLVLRLIATTCCVCVGTVGGVFTPTLFAGAAAGFLGASLLHASQPTSFAIIGLSAFLSAVTHAPWMSIFMAAELTGQWHLLPLLFVSSLLSCAVARRLSPHSLYAIATPEPTDETVPNASPCPGAQALTPLLPCLSCRPGALRQRGSIPWLPAQSGT